MLLKIFVFGYGGKSGPYTAYIYTVLFLELLVRSKGNSISFSKLMGSFKVVSKFIVGDSELSFTIELALSEKLSPLLLS